MRLQFGYHARKADIGLHDYIFPDQSCLCPTRILRLDKLPATREVILAATFDLGTLN